MNVDFEMNTATGEYNLRAGRRGRARGAQGVQGAAVQDSCVLDRDIPLPETLDVGQKVSATASSIQP